MPLGSRRDYYNFAVRYRMDLKARIDVETIRIDELARSHFTEEPDEDGAWVPRVSSPLTEIRRDGSLRAAIAAGASDRRWLLTRIETLFLPINAELVAGIQAWLGS